MPLFTADKRNRASLAVLFAVNILNFWDRNTLGAVAEPVRKEFGLSDTELGALATSFTLVYAVVGLPLGRLADTWSRGKLLAAGVAVWSALTGAAALVNSYGLLLVSRLGVAVGEAVCAPAAASWIGDLFPAGKRSRALALFMLGVPVGAAISFGVSGPVAQAWGWRWAMALAGAPGLLLIPALLRLPEPRRGATEPARLDAGQPSVWMLARIPTLGWIIASGALVNFALYALATFFPAFLTRFHGLSVAEAGLASGAGHLVAGVLGGVAAGVVGDRVIRRRRNGRMLAAAAAALAAAPAAWLGILQPAGAAAAAILLIMAAYGMLSMYYGLVYAAIQDIVAPGLRGTAMAVYFLAMYLCGASFGPLVTGRLSDSLARGRALGAGSALNSEHFRALGLRDAMLVIPLASLGLAAVLWAGSRTIGRDIGRREN